MHIKDLKKYLAGFSIVGLLAGAGLAVGSGMGNAADNAAGKDGTGVTTEQTTPQSNVKGLNAVPTSEPTPTGG